MWFRCSIVMVGFVLAASPPAATAQTPRTVSGTVRDSTGRPLVDAVVAIDPNGDSRSVRVDTQGRFRIDKVPPGRHELRAIWIGFQPDDRTIEVPESGLQVDVVLHVLPFRLDTMTVVARRTGIIGTAILHAPFGPLAGVDVQVMGTKWSARTGADGHFEFPDATEGAYAIEARHDGLKTRVVTAVVPHDAAVEVALVLDSIVGRTDRISENMMRDMEDRLRHRRVFWSALVASQELASQRGVPLNRALRYAPSVLGKAIIFDPFCVVTLMIDGLPAKPGQALSDFRPEDIAMVELYTEGCGEQVTAKQLGTFIVYKNSRPGVLSRVFIWLKH